MSFLTFCNGDTRAAGRGALLAAAVQSRGSVLMSIFNAAGLVTKPATTYEPRPKARYDGPAEPFLVADPERLPRSYLQRQEKSGGRLGEVDPLRVLDFENEPEFAMLGEALFGAEARRGSDETAWFDQCPVILIPPPQPFAQPGQGIVQHAPGTLGFAVAWPKPGRSAQTGFLTAGHVAKVAGGAVRTTGRLPPQTLGPVVMSSDPIGGGSSPAADVALVEGPGPGQSVASVLSQATPSANDQVDVVLSGGALSDHVRAYSPFYFSRTINGTWGEVYQTMSGVTQPGHSGAPVQHFGRAVGTVVAGTPGYVTLVQAIGYQLAATAQPGITLA
jgi:hypothetical protein